MPISIENDRTGATGAVGIEGIFGNQVEQRIGHHIDREDDEIVHLHPQGDNPNNNSNKDSPPASPLPLLSYKPRRSRFNPLSWFSSSSRHGYASLGGPGTHRSNWRRWYHYPGQLYRRASAAGSSTRLGRAVIAYIVSSKRHKSWFLSLILVSLVFTVLSAGYMLSQFHQHELTPPVSPSTIMDENNNNNPSLDVPAAPEGPRRNRDRGKKRPKKNNKPGTQDDKKVSPETDVGARPKTPKGEPKGKPDQKDTPLDGSKVKGGAKGGQKVKPKENDTPDTLGKEDGLRICDLEDITHGEWVSVEGGLPRGLNAAAKDLTWSGYGYAGCRSHIWNERYLLTPTPRTSPDTGSGSPWTRATTAKQDLEYALRAKHLRWQVKGSTVNKKEACRQPEMDIPDFVEVLKRSPLVMVGDKFLELEYLTLECMVLGMQQTLSGTEDPEYQIETEMPPVTELRLGPGKTPESAPRIYRKAKPGKMQLVDRVSNLTLATFIRSDVLWDADIHPDQGDTSALHPDCKLVGAALLCEPALMRDEKRVNSPPPPPASNDGSWWKWWISDNPSSTTQDEAREQDQDQDELAIGSDLDQDMINLEWVSILKQTVEQERNNKVLSEDNAPKGGENKEGPFSPRKPTVVISNGLFWKYDPRETSTDAILDSIASSQGGADKAAALKASRASRRNRKLTKTELEQIKAYQYLRRKQLKQRYATLLASTLEYIHTSWPELRVVVQTSVKHRPCEALAMAENVGELSVQEQTEQEAALLNALTKTVVARVQDPLYSFLDTTLLRLYRDASPNKSQCRNFMMPGPLDTLVEQLYGELFRLDI
ncbi:hypothetical protein BGZ74_003225 [Mortierella antarctica]|nr:hypothetical protein BGZ74_003225 [Mortierella antarctica]